MYARQVAGTPPTREWRATEWDTGCASARLPSEGKSQLHLDE